MAFCRSQNWLPLLFALAFEKGLAYCWVALQWSHGDDSTILCKNLVNIGPVTSGLRREFVELIFALTRLQFNTRPSFGTLAFWNELQHCNFDCSELINNDFCTLCRNFVRFGWVSRQAAWQSCVSFSNLFLVVSRINHWLVGLVLSRLDYINTTLAGLSWRQLGWLMSLRGSHYTCSISFHGLRTSECIKFKLAIIDIASCSWHCTSVLMSSATARLRVRVRVHVRVVAAVSADVTSRSAALVDLTSPCATVGHRSLLQQPAMDPAYWHPGLLSF